MPAKRRLPKGRHHSITPEAVEAFRAGDERTLRQELRLPPWHINPLDPGIWGPKPDYLEASSLCSAPTWEVALELRRELEEAAEEAAADERR